ncbi:hypothetical protein Tco_0994804 [Tanacetum coccineum]
MDNPNITMEEYIRLQEEKSLSWAIVLDNTLTSDASISCGPMVTPLNDNEIDFRISFDESDDEDYTVVYDENSFSYKIISVNNLKTDSGNDNDKVNMPLSPEPKQDVTIMVSELPGFSLTKDQVANSSGTVSGTLFLNGRAIFVLFDTGTTDFASDHEYLNCPLRFDDKFCFANLLPLEMSDFDISLVFVLVLVLVSISNPLGEEVLIFCLRVRSLRCLFVKMFRPFSKDTSFSFVWLLDLFDIRLYEFVGSCLEYATRFISIFGLFKT